MLPMVRSEVLLKIRIWRKYCKRKCQRLVIQLQIECVSKVKGLKSATILCEFLGTILNNKAKISTQLNAYIWMPEYKLKIPFELCSLGKSEKEIMFGIWSLFSETYQLTDVTNLNIVYYCIIIIII